MQSNATSATAAAPSGSPPIGARRVKTDLHTSENLYVHSVGRSRSNSPMHAAGLLARHGHRKAASEPKGIVPGNPGAPGASFAPSSMTFLTVPGGSSRCTLPNPSRQRSSSTGTSTKTSTLHQRTVTAFPQTTPGDGGRSTGVRLSPSPSPSRANDQLASGAGAVNRSQLPARARLLTRRLQNNATPTNGSESPRSIDSLPRRTLAGAYKTATLSQFHSLANNNNNNIADSGSTATNSAEDLTLLDKSLRNSMLQDVVHFKKQLVRLRRILQEDEENLMMTDTLNPFENNNGQFFTTAAAVAAATGNISGSSNGNSIISGTDGSGPGLLDSNKQQENGASVLIRESGVAALALLEDQRQELADLRRQVVYLQGELTTKDRTIRQQQNLIEKYEAEREKIQRDREGSPGGAASTEATAGGAPVATNGEDLTGGDRNHSETVSQATQTERLRPVSFGGQEGLGSRNEQPTVPKNGLRTTTTTATAASSNSLSSPSSHHTNGHGPSASGSRTTPTKTQISSVYTQLSSVRHSTGGSSVPTTPSTPGGPVALRRTSLGSSHNLSAFGLHGAGSSPTGSSASKSVRTTHIGTLAAATGGRQLTNGDRIPVLVNGAAKQAKLTTASQSRTVPGTQTNGSSLPTSHKANNGLNGVTATKRTAATIIRPPSSFGGSITGSPLDTAQQALLKSKSAPSTPLVATGKLLTAPATGNTTEASCHTNGPSELTSAESSTGAENDSSGKETSTDECDSDHGTLMNGTATLLGTLKLLPNGAGGIGATAGTPSEIVGH